jgi:hypothetical protein
MLILIAILAILLRAGQWTYDRYGRPKYTQTYYIWDLLRLDGRMDIPVTLGEVSEQASLLTSSVTPDVWWFRTGSVTPFFLSKSLIVRHTATGHQQVAEWLRRRRQRLYL